jgi:hypothetical protein
VSATVDALGSRAFDPLSSSAVGTTLAGAASLIWPELVAGTVTLAALASFLLWVRVLRALRQRRIGDFRSSRVIPLAGLGAAGWGTALLVGPIFPAGRALVLGAASLGLWLLARSTLVGV